MRRRRQEEKETEEEKKEGRRKRKSLLRFSIKLHLKTSSILFGKKKKCFFMEGKKTGWEEESKRSLNFFFPFWEAAINHWAMHAAVVEKYSFTNNFLFLLQPLKFLFFLSRSLFEMFRSRSFERGRHRSEDESWLWSRTCTSSYVQI